MPLMNKTQCLYKFGALVLNVFHKENPLFACIERSGVYPNLIVFFINPTPFKYKFNPL